MKTNFRKATPEDQNEIWKILQDAILRRKADGSEQWQDGYPNTEVVAKDIEVEAGYVLEDEERIVGYVALLINDEPAYEAIEGKWLTTGDFVVYHRVAIAEKAIGKGYARFLLQAIEEWTLENKVFSLKADTNFDNKAMLALFEKMGYIYCGEVFFRGASRKAFEKVLSKI